MGPGMWAICFPETGGGEGGGPRGGPPRGGEKGAQTVPTGRVIKYPPKCALFRPPGGPPRGPPGAPRGPPGPGPPDWAPRIPSPGGYGWREPHHGVGRVIIGPSPPAGCRLIGDRSVGEGGKRRVPDGRPYVRWVVRAPRRRTSLKVRTEVRAGP